MLDANLKLCLMSETYLASVLRVLQSNELSHQWVDMLEQMQRLKKLSINESIRRRT